MTDDEFQDEVTRVVEDICNVIANERERVAVAACIDLVARQLASIETDEAISNAFDELDQMVDYYKSSYLADELATHETHATVN